MENLFTHFDLTEFPQIDKKERKEEIIEAQKKSKKNIKRQQKPGEEKNVLLLWKTM